MSKINGDELIKNLREKISELEEDAKRYRWIRENVTEQITPESLMGDYSEHKAIYILPRLIAWTCFSGYCSLDEVIDMHINDESNRGERGG